MLKSIEWTGRSLRIIDQTEIPSCLVYKDLNTIEEVFEAIQRLRVRGAPAIGIAAAYGLYLGLRTLEEENRDDFIAKARHYAEYLSQARPTAVNLGWALNRILSDLSKLNSGVRILPVEVLEIAQYLHQDDIERCNKIGEYGSELIEDGMTILTHCNTGLLATTGIGTALGIIYTARKKRKKITVLVDETRPLLQGARLTMWELHEAGIPATLITDGMAAYALQKRKVDMVIVGADRIAKNGDVANKIGTYNLAVNCRYHRVPFYVAAPLSSFDFLINSGDQIPIEERSCQEITDVLGRIAITVKGANCWNPAFDVTPANLIKGIITEGGIYRQPLLKTLNKLNKITYQN
jgi:methylthioribose-1-phosphate isomerase